MTIASSAWIWTTKLALWQCPWWWGNERYGRFSVVGWLTGVLTKMLDAVAYMAGGLLATAIFVLCGVLGLLTWKNLKKATVSQFLTVFDLVSLRWRNMAMTYGALISGNVYTFYILSNSFTALCTDRYFTTVQCKSLHGQARGLIVVSTSGLIQLKSDPRS